MNKISILDKILLDIFVTVLVIICYTIIFLICNTGSDDTFRFVHLGAPNILVLFP